MAHTIELRLLNNSSQLNVEVGSSLMEVLQNSTLEQPYPFIAARVNNVYKGLGYRIYKPVTVEYFDLRDYEGYRVYQRTLSFVLQKASHDIFPERKLRIRHSLGNGFYAEYEDRKPLSYEDATLLKLRMEAIVAENIPI